jgi:hypothetical protein
MKWPKASLTDQQVRTTFFKVPEIDYVYRIALGETDLNHFKEQRHAARCCGGELLLIGWPDGTTITHHIPDAADLLDVESLVNTYRASAALHRITKLDLYK